jgi:hypothetical protein
MYIYNMSRSNQQSKQYNIRPIPPANKPICKRPDDSGSSIASTMFSSMIQGFGFGAGSSIAHRAVASIGDSLTTVPSIPSVKYASTESNSRPDCTEIFNVLLQSCKDNNSIDCDKSYIEYLKCLDN